MFNNYKDGMDPELRERIKDLNKRKKELQVELVNLPYRKHKTVDERDKLNSHIKSINIKIDQLESSKNRNNDHSKKLQKDIGKILKSQNSFNFAKNTRVNSYKFNSQLDISALKEYKLEGMVEESNQLEVLFWTKNVYEIIEKLAQPD